VSTPTSRNLNRRLLHNLQQDTTDTCAEEGSIPAEYFTDPDILARERRALFSSVPQPVAFSGEIPEAGSYLTLDILDTPVLLVRGEDQTLRAFINACAHRGAPVAHGGGAARSFVCPFHGWAYDHQGRLKGRPGDSHFNIPPGDCALSPLPVSENHGVVVVAMAADVPQDTVDSALDEIGAELAAYGFENYRGLERRQLAVDANWKLVNDLSLESYHFRTLHRDSVAEVLAPNAVVDTWQRHSRWAFPVKTIKQLANLKEEDWPDSLQGSVTYTLYPGVMLLVNALGAQMIRAEPCERPNKTRIDYVGVHAPGCDRDAALQAYRFGGDVFANEDLPAARDCQRGIAARGGNYPLGRNEPLLQFWHRLWENASGKD